MNRQNSDENKKIPSRPAAAVSGTPMLRNNNTASAGGGIQESGVKDGLPPNSRKTQNDSRRQEWVYETFDSLLSTGEFLLGGGQFGHTKPRRRNPQLQDRASSPQPEDSSSSGLFPLPPAPSVNTLITSMGACSFSLEESNYTSEPHSTLRADLQRARTKLKKCDNPAPKDVSTGVQDCVNPMGDILMRWVPFRESVLDSDRGSQRSSFFGECPDQFHSNTPTLPIRRLASPSNLQRPNPNGFFANYSYSAGFNVRTRQKINIPSGSENDLDLYLQKQKDKRGYRETIVANPSKDAEDWDEETDRGESVVFGGR